jgi:hypothetical protein
MTAGDYLGLIPVISRRIDGSESASSWPVMTDPSLAKVVLFVTGGESGAAPGIT